MEECYFYYKKVTLLRGCFSRFLNCTNGTKSRNAPQMGTLTRNGLKHQTLQFAKTKLRKLSSLKCLLIGGVFWLEGQKIVIKKTLSNGWRQVLLKIQDKIE